MFEAPRIACALAIAYAYCNAAMSSINSRVSNSILASSSQLLKCPSQAGRYFWRFVKVDSVSCTKFISLISEGVMDGTIPDRLFFADLMVEDTKSRDLLSSDLWQRTRL